MDLLHRTFRICVSLLQLSTPVPLFALHSAARGDLVLPRTRRRLGNRAFCVAGPIAWNSLPPDIRTASSFIYIQESTQDSLVYPVLLCNVIRVSYAVRRSCSDFMDMLRRLTSCRIIIYYYYYYYY